MFEDQSLSQPTQGSASQPAEQPISPSTVAPGSAPAPDPKENHEPEDIFGKADPVESPAKQEASVASPQDEPSIKTPPSVFTKKPDTAVPLSDVNMPDTPPMPPLAPSQAPKAPTNKKNMAIFIVITLASLGLVAAGIWWFTGRDVTEDKDSNVASLFSEEEQDQASFNEESVEPTLPVGPADSAEPVKIPDADGDGLSDEEEIALGTSLNSPDTDNDGLYDQEEIKIYATDPLRPDTDNDGWTDGQEIELHQDPLAPDAGNESGSMYFSDQFKLRFSLIDGLVLESSDNNTLQFNDNVNQIKLYVYLAGSAPTDLTPDMIYNISEDSSGNLAIASHESYPDQTPYSTDFITTNYQSQNGNSYLIRYLATKRAPDHQQKFEQILLTFQFLN